MDDSKIRADIHPDAPTGYGPYSISVEYRAPVPQPAPAPETCGTCNGRLQVFVTEAADPKVFEGGTVTYAIPCPTCRPATAAPETKP